MEIIKLEAGSKMCQKSHSKKRYDTELDEAKEHLKNSKEGIAAQISQRTTKLNALG